MESERWQKVKEVLHRVLEQEPGSRAAFLAEACAGDESLRQQVEELLSSYEQAGSFFETPATKEIARVFEESQAESLVGKSLGPYRVISQLGAGGMGEVYLAQDTRLGRKVALKLLPPYFITDTERVRRFRQEARSASALNHPNIITMPRRWPRRTRRESFTAISSQRTSWCATAAVWSKSWTSDLPSLRKNLPCNLPALPRQLSCKQSRTW